MASWNNQASPAPPRCSSARGKSRSVLITYWRVTRARPTTLGHAHPRASAPVCPRQKAQGMGLAWRTPVWNGRSPAPPRCFSARRKSRNVLITNGRVTRTHARSLELDGRVPRPPWATPIREHPHTVCPCQKAQGVGCRRRRPFGNGGVPLRRAASRLVANPGMS
jgi:hypothetical protein